jgi:hypothetical protein
MYFTLHFIKELSDFWVTLYVRARLYSSVSYTPTCMNGMVKNRLHVVQTGSGTHPNSYPKSTKNSFPGGKAARA